MNKDVASEEAQNISYLLDDYVCVIQENDDYEIWSGESLEGKNKTILEIYLGGEII
jgi:hypothetical protein